MRIENPKVSYTHQDTHASNHITLQHCVPWLRQRWKGLP